MPALVINGAAVEVAEGALVLDAAAAVEVEIPTLCYLKECGPETSCMLCVVKDLKTSQLIPACSAKAVDGMEIDTTCDEVVSARRDVLNLLLSEHVGDCEAPCTRICPAHLDIPLMLREIGRGNMESAAWIARRDLAIPVSLGFVCPAPCEKGCRRGKMDSSITIRGLHRDVAKEFPSPDRAFPVNGKSAAVIGSGAAGLSAAWQLRQLGYGCTIHDEGMLAGGALRQHPDLPADVLDEEIEYLRLAGIEFRMGEAPSLHEISDHYDGVVFASDEYAATHFSDAFYAEEHRLTVKAVSNGKAAATALDRFLKGETPAKDRFDSKVGSLRESEIVELAKNCGESRTVHDRQAEAARCLHCDCRKPVNCRLRRYAEEYSADQRAYPADERDHIQLLGHDESVIFEPGKCIKCGLCLKVTGHAGDTPGLTFTGRGFNTQVTVPFGESLQQGLKDNAAKAVAVCPTGALAFRSGDEKLEG